MVPAVAFLTTLAAVALFAQPSDAQVRTQCDTLSVEVTAPTEGLARRSCTAASTAHTVLSECGIRPPERVKIVVDTAAVDGLPHCLGSYNCDTRTVKVLTPSSLSELQKTPQMIYAGIDPKLLFESLIVHELTHAALDQAGLNDSLGTTGHEYLAYVMQLRAKSDSDRTRFLANQQAPAPDTLEQINIFLLLTAPGGVCSSGMDAFRRSWQWM